MSEFSARSDSVDVEKLMDKIRARIREKRGVDYTEAQIREVAAVKLEKFLDPTKVRSDLIMHYLGQRPSKDQRFQPPPPVYFFRDDDFHSSSPGILRRIVTRALRVVNPVLRRVFAPKQRQIDAYHASQFAHRQELEALYFELFNNLVLNLTRAQIELNNQRMRLDAMSGRLDFHERRARMLEGVVQYRPGIHAPPEAVDPKGKGPRRRSRRDPKPTS